MDLDIYYPYNIPFFTDKKFIDVKFVNNDDHYINIYFVDGNKLGKLAGLVFPHTERKYRFPESSIVAIISENNPRKYQCFIKLIDGMKYIYP